ncbi:zf-TFIIB domain-containing protein [Patescibacteria group bacterium]|nr:zf-TFIIB domain-containing protein [Patescibacteria group bacterium]
MQCLSCEVPLGKAILANVEVDYCPRCYGLWFDEGELELAKDEKDGELRWIDIDLWQDPSKLHILLGGKLCPVDRFPLYEVRYGDSDIKVDVCNLCHGIWLDRSEFKAILVYLRDKEVYDVLHHYVKDLFEEMWEIFSGPELLRDEVYDFLALLKLLRYKFATQHPAISQAILSLPK